MNLYLAASSDTKTKISAYAYKLSNYEIVSAKHDSSTTPRELLIGLKNMLTYIVQYSISESEKEFTLFTNNEFVINMINEDKLIEWRNSSWMKSNGEEVANKDVLNALHQFIMFFKEKHITLYATKPVTSEEINILNSVSKAALARRKF